MECPGCKINFNHHWDDFLFSRNEVNISVCPACHLRYVKVYVHGPDNRYNKPYTTTVSFKEAPLDETPVVEVAFDGQNLYVLPNIAFDYYKTPKFKEIPDNVPHDLARDCMEARKILADSPRASALFARRILEKVLKDHGHNGRTLYDQLRSIENSKELLTIDIEKLHAVRNLGNISAHYTEKSQTLLDVEPHEAELCLQIVDELFTHYYVTPAEVNRINQKATSSSE